MKFGAVIPQTLFFFRLVLAILGFSLSYKFENQFVGSCKTAYWDFDWNFFKSIGKLGKIDILSFTYEHRISIVLFRSSLIFYECFLNFFIAISCIYFMSISVFVTIINDINVKFQLTFVILYPAVLLHLLGVLSVFFSPLFWHIFRVFLIGSHVVYEFFLIL